MPNSRTIDNEAQGNEQSPVISPKPEENQAKLASVKYEKETIISIRNVAKGRARIAAARLERQQRLLQEAVSQSKLNSVARP